MKKEIDSKGRLRITFTKSEAKRLKELLGGINNYEIKLLYNELCEYLER